MVYVRFFRNHHTGTYVPGPASNFPVSIQGAHGDMGKVESGRAHGTHTQRHFTSRDAALGVADEALERASLLFHHLQRPVGAPFKGNERLLERRQRRWLHQRQRTTLGMQRRSREGAMALATGKQLTEERREDHTDGRFAMVHEADGNADEREPLDKVRRPIDGIDDPCGIVGQRMLLASGPAFLSNESA